MKKVCLNEQAPYTAPGHINFTGLKLHGREETGVQSFRMSLSYFLPGGGTEFIGADAQVDKVFMVLEGEVTFKTKTEEVTVGPMDSVSFAPNEGREIKNHTNRPAAVLVITGY